MKTWLWSTTLIILLACETFAASGAATAAGTPLLEKSFGSASIKTLCQIHPDRVELKRKIRRGTSWETVYVDELKYMPVVKSPSEIKRLIAVANLGKTRTARTRRDLPRLTYTGTRARPGKPDTVLLRSITSGEKRHNSTKAALKLIQILDMNCP